MKRRVPHLVLAASIGLLLAACGTGAGLDTTPTPRTLASPTTPSRPSPTTPGPTNEPSDTDEPSETAEPTGSSGSRSEPATVDPDPPADPTTVTVEVVDFDYRPASVPVTVGDTVSWSHVGDVAHTVTFSSGGPDSGSLSTGDTFDVTFEQPGTFTYRCLFHSQMQGTVSVA